MNVDAAIKAAQERLHRQIGQWARFAHRKVKERAATERVAMGLVTQGWPTSYWMQETSRFQRSAWDGLLSMKRSFLEGTQWPGATGRNP